jgi:hypothetical protein
MDSIVLELQRDALNKQISISDLLRKAYVVARKLGVSEFEKWAESELDGYENMPQHIPDYRQITGAVMAWNQYQGWQSVFFPNSDLEKRFTRRPCDQSIAEIESLLVMDKTGFYNMPFPPETEQALRKAIKFHTQITLEVPRTALVRIVDAVRTTILNWSIKLEEDGIVGEGLSFTTEERKVAEKISYNINNFFAPVHSSQIQQQTSQSCQVVTEDKLNFDLLKGFLQSLSNQINEINLKPEIEKELISDINALKSQTESPKPKQSIISESIGSIRRILESAGGGVASQLLIQLGKAFLS